MPIDENDVKVRERLTRLEADLQTEIKQREKLDAIVEDMRDIVSELRHLRLDYNGLNERVQEIAEKPVKRWDGLISAIIGAIGGGLVTFIITKFIGG